MKTLQFSKLPLSSGRVLQQRKTLQNHPQSQPTITPTPSLCLSSTTPSSKKITFAARLTNLSSSSISFLSSNSSFGTPLNISSTSLDDRSIPNDIKHHSFSQLKLYQKVQPFRNNENQQQPSPLMLIKKTQSNYQEGYGGLNSSRLLEKYKVKPVFEEGSGRDGSGEGENGGRESKVEDWETRRDRDRIQQLEREIARKDSQISSLHHQLSTSKHQHQLLLSQSQHSSSQLSQTIQQLNLIIFQLRNTKQYQIQIISILEQKHHCSITQKQSLLYQIQLIKQEKYELWEHNRNLNILLEKFEREEVGEVIDDSINYLENKGKIEELEKALMQQNGVLKGLKGDVKKREERIGQLEEFIDQINGEVMKECLMRMDKECMRQQNREFQENMY